MKKESAIFSLLRYLIGFGILFFLVMLYWSSTLVEDHLMTLSENMTQLKTAIENRSNELSELIKERNTNQAALSTIEKNDDVSVKDNSKNVEERSQIDKTLPNLLEEDPYYAHTLPNELGKGFNALGIRRNEVISKPINLNPFAGWVDVSTWNSLCSVTLGKLKFGIYETLSPDMAIKMEERDRKDGSGKEYWLHLRDGVYWEPLKKSFFPSGVKLADRFLKKHQVTAHDFKFYYDAFMNPYNQELGAGALRTLYDDLEEIVIIDDVTLIVRWKTQEFTNDKGEKEKRTKYIAKSLTAGLSPLPRFVYQYFPDGSKIIEDDQDKNTYRTNSVWAQNFSNHWAKNIIVSCGAWTFDGMSDREIKFVRKENFYEPLTALSRGWTYEFKNSTDGLWQDFKILKTDHYSLQPDKVSEWETFQESDLYKEQQKNGFAINRIDYLNRSFSYIGWNNASPLFQSKKVRQAMTLAIDRQRIINQNLNGNAVEINGPFFRNSSDYNESLGLWPYDPMQAKKLLEEDGWVDLEGDGILKKEIDGKRVPFIFSLTYFVKSSLAKSICEYVATALKEINIVCNLNGLDLTDLSASMDDKTFDAILMNWGLATPPENPRQIWDSQEASKKGSSNIIQFKNAEIDEIIDKLDYESNPIKRKELYRRFTEIIFDEQPYTFLFTPRIILLYRDWLKNVFIPAYHQDIVPGANVAEPISTAFWLDAAKLPKDNQ